MRKLTTLGALLLASSLLSCTVAATTVAIKQVKKKRSESAMAQVDVSPKELYDAQMKTYSNREDVSIISNDPENYTIEARVAGDRVRSAISPSGEQGALFRVDAESEDPLKPGESPAVDFEREILDRLNIDSVIQGR